MICPECTSKRPAFSSRCPACCAQTGLLSMWVMNLVAYAIVWFMMLSIVTWIIK
jgi:Zn ribbon nucleic-acid-binding protein